MSIVKHSLYWLVVLATSIILHGCGGSGSKSPKPSPSPVNKTITVSGVAQKGLFQSLDIQVKEYDSKTSTWVNKAKANFTDSNYTIDVSEDTLAVIEASGAFVDETTGKAQNISKPLKVVVAPAKQSIQSNINLITHASAERFLKKHAKKPSAPVTEAISESDKFVNGVFGFAESNDAKKADITKIVASDTIDSPNVNLLLLSSAILQQSKGATGIESYIADMVESVASAQSLEEAKPVLGFLNGLNAQTLYEQASVTLTNLPELKWVGDPVVWQCPQANVCDWKPQDPKTLSINNITLYEADARSSLRVSLPQNATEDVPIALAIKGGTATNKKDYILPLTAKITKGRRYVDVPLQLVIDTLTEPNETIELELSTTADGYKIVNAAALVTIKDGAPSPLPYNAQNKVALANFCLLDIAPTDFNGRVNCSTDEAEIKPVVVDGVTAAHVKLELTDTCNTADCRVSTSGVLVDFVLQTKDAAGNAQSETDMGQHRYPFAALNQASSSPLLIAMNTNDMAAALVEAKNNNWSAEIVARFPQRPNDNKAAVLTSPPAAIPSVLMAGDLELPINSSAVVIADGTGTCNNSGQLIKAEFLSPVGDKSVVKSACVEVEVKTENNQKRLTAKVSEGELDITGLTIPLAAGHLIYGFSANFSTDNTGQAQNLGDFVNISLPSEQGLVLAHGLWLHSQGMPVGFRVKRGVIRPEGLFIEYDQTDYFMQGEFSASDPRRGKAAASNDAIYSTLAGTAGEFKYTSSGIQLALNVPAGKAKTAYPKGDIKWDGFKQNVVDGKMQTAPINFTYELFQFADCRKLECNNNSSRRYHVQGENIPVAASGVLHGVAQVGLPQGQSTVQNPAWGAISPNQFAFSRPSDLASASPVTLTLPGYRFREDFNVPSVAYYLMGHLVSDTANNADILQSFLSTQSKLGNGFPVGLSIGPEYYANASGDPEKGGGTLLNGSQLDINNGQKTNAIMVNNAAKYVVRNSGITGVFNADTNSLNTAFDVNGYSLNLSRFAVRMIDNALDPYNWIDGKIAIEGDAGLEMHFTNFELDCSAKFNQALLTYEKCDNTDNNNNSIVDENCPQMLKAWAAETQIFDLSFTSDSVSSPASQCAGSKQQLQLEQHIQFAALDKPIKAKAVWSNTGKLISNNVTLLDQYRLDATQDDQGFLVQLRNAKLAVTDKPKPADNHGWLAMAESDFFVPFWDSVKTDIRLANKPVALGVAPEPDSTIVVNQKTLSKLDQAKTELNNTQLYNQDAFADAQYQIQAKYEWGNTGFGFKLPVYYSPFRLNDDNQSRFLGIKQEADLFVLEANAGIDFIESGRTKLSFGASADFKRLKSIKFQVDLDNPDNLKKVDNFLVSVNVIQNPVIEPALQYPQTLLYKINRFANKGVDDLIRQQLEKGLKIAAEQAAANLPTGEDPFITTSKSLAWIKSLPQQIEVLLRGRLQRPVNSLINNTRQSLRNDLSLLKSKLDSLNQNDPIPSDVFSTINRIKQTIRLVKTELNAIDRQISAPANQANTIVDQANGYLVQLDEAVKQVDSLLEQVAAFNTALCQSSQNTSDQVKGYIEPFLSNLADIKQLLQFIQAGNVLDPITTIVSEDAAVKDNIRSTQKQVARQAKSLLNTVSEIETKVRNEICSAGINEVLAGAKSVTSEIQQNRQQAQALLSSIKNDITNIVALKNKIKTQILAPVNQAYTVVDALETELKERRDEFKTASISGEINTLLRQSTSGLITVLVVDSTSLNTDRDITNVLFDDVQKEFNQTLELAINTLRREVETAFKVAYYTPNQLREMLVNRIMNADPVSELRNTSNQYLAEVNRKVNEIVTDITDQVNTAVKTALAKAETQVNEALAQATAPVKNIPLDSAGLDGFGIIAGNELERVHIGAQWIMSPAAEGESPTSFNAALDAVSWNASNKTAGCSIPDGQSLIDVTISSTNLPAKIADSDITVRKVYLGFTLDQAGGAGGLLPKGVFGGISTSGDIGFTEFVIYDPAFAAGIGVQETYLGASAGALFSDVQMELAFFAGKSCNQDILLELDPDVAKFITLPPNGFAGFYARGSASFPVWTNGCALTVGVGADVGTWMFVGTPSTFGGLVGGRAYGQALCIASLAGKVRALAEITTEGDVSFVGSGFGAAGVGWCEPAGWTTVKRSREDSFCGTGDVQFSAGYKNGWKLFNIEASAVH